MTIIDDILITGIAIYNKHNIGCELKDTYFGMKWFGIAYPQARIVQLYYDQQIKPELLASIIVHELCHVLAYDRKKYMNYHTSNTGFRDVRHLEITCRTALKAERYVDRMAENMFREFFPNMQYNVFYRSEHDVQFMRNNLKRLKEYHMPILKAKEKTVDRRLRRKKTKI